MSDKGKGSSRQIGFLTAIELPQGGYVGGLLVTNHLGRPLEFQCTAPVKPNRTQEILYGPTLVPFLLSEVIGSTLIEKATVKPDLVLTEQEEILDLSERIDIPVAYLNPNIGGMSVEQIPLTGETLRLGQQTLRIYSEHSNDEKTLKKISENIPEEADLYEPFERVREALKEALQLGNGAA